VRTTQRHYQSRNVICDAFVAPRATLLHCHGYPRASAYELYDESSVLQKGVANPEIHRNVATAQFSGGIDVRTRLKLLFPISFRGEFRDFYTLGNPSFGIPVQRSEQYNLVISEGLVVHF